MNFLIVLISGLAFALPEMKLKEEWRVCKVDADCIVAGDACRSCGNLKFVNRLYKEEAIRADQVARKEVRTCEACQTTQIKVVCSNKLCVEGPKSSGK